jgi:hypothetical protein
MLFKLKILHFFQHSLKEGKSVAKKVLTKLILDEESCAATTFSTTSETLRKVFGVISAGEIRGSILQDAVLAKQNLQRLLDDEECNLEMDETKFR